MNDDLNRLENWLEPLINKLSTAERAKLARSIGTELRKSNQARIKAQRNVDGTPYAPRRSQHMSNRIKRRAMFRQLRQNKYMRLATNANRVSIGFTANVSKVARVHHYGLRDKVRKDGPDVQYEKRELLGFSKEDEALIMDKVIEHLGI